MSLVIPFVSKATKAETDQWLAALSKAVPEVKFIPFKALDSPLGHKTAVVANPDPADISALGDLVWVQSLWAGVEKLVTEPALEKIGISRLVDPQLAKTMAEAVLAWTFYLHRDMPHYKTLQNQRIWQELPYVAAAERRVGVMGLGKLGEAAATVLTQNGFNVMGWSRSKKSVAGVRCFHGDNGLSAMVQQSDILVCLLPLTPATTRLIDAKLIGQLPYGAALINFGRGPTLDTAALVAALNSGALKHCVLDVFDKEPLQPDSPLWTHPGITVLPHISAPTTIAAAAEIAATNLRAYLKDGTLPELVDRDRGY